MKSGNNDILKQIPLLDLQPHQWGGMRLPLSFTPDLPNCFVECTDTGDLVADEVYMLYFFYWDKIIRRQ